MLTLSTHSGPRLCNGLTRRDALRIGALGLGGFTLANQLRAASEAGSYVRDRAVVLLFLAGGPSQHETFDPKPDGPEGSTSVAGHILTALPGVRSRPTCRNWRRWRTGSRWCVRSRRTMPSTAARTSSS